MEYFVSKAYFSDLFPNLLYGIHPIFLISFQICSMGFISGVYGGIKTMLIFSGTIKVLALCQAAPSHTRIILSFEYDSDKWLRNTFMQLVLQYGKTRKQPSPVIGSTAP